MIKINLATRKTANISGDAPSANATQAAIASIKSLNFSDLLEIPKLKSIILLVVAYFISGWILESVKVEELAKIDQAIKNKTTEIEELKKKLGENKSLESLKKEIESDEKILQTKFDVITKLSDGRATPTRLLIKVSESIPKEVWLTEYYMANATGWVGIKGFATSFDQLSALSTALQGTIYFKGASPKNNTKVKDSSGLEVISFDMPLERRL